MAALGSELKKDLSSRKVKERSKRDWHLHLATLHLMTASFHSPLDMLTPLRAYSETCDTMKGKRNREESQ
jgi:hypothetical protein